MIRVTEIRNTCSACPSQWEGLTDDEQVVYIRFRWGHLSVGVDHCLDEAICAAPIFTWDDSDMCNGVMDYGQLKELTGGVLELPEMETE
jgi:hypothetical protein